MAYKTMNPTNPVQRNRLFAAIEHHYKALADMRKLRTELIADYAGSLYGTGSAKQKMKIAVSLMHQACDALMLVLAANNPRYLITPKTAGLRGFALRYQEALNQLVCTIHLQETLEQIARDAFFGAGFGLVHLGDAPDVQVEADVWMDPGQPYVSRISQDDHVYDTSAKDYRKVSFALHRYDIPFHWLVEDKIRFNRPAVKELLKMLNEPGATDQGERAEMARGIGSDSAEQSKDQFQPTVDLVDVWIPEYQMICTWATGPRMQLFHTAPLNVQDWDGPETGPYRMLNLGPVPDNILPSSPAIHLKFLFDLANSIYRKLGQQARRMKQVLVYPKGSEEDAKAAAAVADGGTLGMIDPQAANVIEWGSVNNNILGLGIHVNRLFDSAAGNISYRMGLGAQAPTAAQEQIMGGQVGRSEGATQRRMMDFTAAVGRDLGYLMFSDPLLTMEFSQRIDGTDISVPGQWTPGDRKGRWNDYDFLVEPFSMQYRSPQERAATINQFLAGIVPLLPLMMQDGYRPDWGDFFDMNAELLGEPRLKWLMRRVGVDPAMAQGASHDASQSPVTRREYSRTSSGAGQNPDDKILQAALSGSAA